MLINPSSSSPGQRAGTRPGRKVLVRVDGAGAGAGHAYVDWLTEQFLRAQ